MSRHIGAVLEDGPERRSSCARIWTDALDGGLGNVKRLALWPPGAKTAQAASLYIQKEMPTRSLVGWDVLPSLAARTVACAIDVFVPGEGTMVAHQIKAWKAILDPLASNRSERRSIESFARRPEGAEPTFSIVQGEPISIAVESFTIEITGEVRTVLGGNGPAHYPCLKFAIAIDDQARSDGALAGRLRNLAEEARCAIRQAELGPMAAAAVANVLRTVIAPVVDLLDVFVERLFVRRYTRFKDRRGPRVLWAMPVPVAPGHPPGRIVASLRRPVRGPDPTLVPMPSRRLGRLAYA